MNPIPYINALTSFKLYELRAWNDEAVLGYSVALLVPYGRGNIHTKFAAGEASCRDLIEVVHGKWNWFPLGVGPTVQLALESLETRLARLTPSISANGEGTTAHAAWNARVEQACKAINGFDPAAPSQANMAPLLAVPQQWP